MDLRWEIALLSCAVLLLPFTAAAQDSESEALAKEVEDKLFFVRHFDRCYDQLEREAKTLRDEHAGSQALAALHRRINRAWADSLARKGDESGALGRLGPVLEEGASTESYRPAARSAGGLEEALAKRAADDAAAGEHLDRALALYRSIGDGGAVERVLGRLVDIRSKEGLRSFGTKDYDRAYDLLSRLDREFPGGIPKGEAAEALRFLKELTGVLTIETISVTAAGTDVTGNARLLLTPEGSGEKKEMAVPRSLRWVVGTYELSITVPGTRDAVLTLPVALGTRGARVRIPARIPPGMVYIPEGGGQPAFFIDRTEVRIGDYRRFDRDYPKGLSSDLPAHGVPYDRASRFAASVKKRLPTRAQWIRAAFGDTRNRYPWGNEPPAGRCNIGTGKPQAVGSNPSGASRPYRLLNMAGNVWEWLRDGYAIGGGYRVNLLAARPAEWTRDADFLRDPKPDNSIWESAPPDVQRKYSGYKVYSGNLVEVGLRCVIEL